MHLFSRAIRRVSAVFRARLACGAVVACAAGAALATPVVPTLARPEDRVRFRVTAFATGLAYPTSMTTLADGSLLVATSDGGPSWLANYVFTSQRGALVRLVDVDGDGVADGQPQTVAADLPGLVTSVRRVGDLVFALSAQGGAQAVSILRTGSTAVAPLAPVGRLAFSFPTGAAGFEHTSFALAARPTGDGSVELYFNVGSQKNSTSTPADVTVGLTARDGASFVGRGDHQLAADSIHRVLIRDQGGAITVSAPVQIARGLRNAAGMTFDGSGNLWLEDNGIDTEGNRGIAFSADELNRVAAADLGVSVPNFGFAGTYVNYADGATVGPIGGVTSPVAVFLPVAGRKSEGAVEVAFAPGSFPADLAGKVVVPFSGKFNQGGPANDENPVVVVDPETGERFHFIADGVMGHPNGVLAADAGLFITDLNYTGAFGDPIVAGVVNNGDGINADREGVVYLVTPVPEPSAWAMALAALGCGALAVRRRAIPRLPRSE